MLVVAVAEPPLPVDPDPIRVITPGQSDDQAGRGAMQELIPTDSPRHFLLTADLLRLSDERLYAEKERRGGGRVPGAGS